MSDAFEQFLSAPVGDEDEDDFLGATTKKGSSSRRSKRGKSGTSSRRSRRIEERHDSARSSMRRSGRGHDVVDPLGSLVGRDEDMGNLGGGDLGGFAAFAGGGGGGGGSDPFALDLEDSPPDTRSRSRRAQKEERRRRKEEEQQQRDSTRRSTREDRVQAIMDRLKKERQEMGVEETPVGTEGEEEEEEEGRREAADAEAGGDAASRAPHQRTAAAADDPYSVMNQSLHMDLPGGQGAEESPARGRAAAGTPDADQDDSLLGADTHGDRGHQMRNPFEDDSLSISETDLQAGAYARRVLASRRSAREGQGAAEAGGASERAAMAARAAPDVEEEDDAEEDSYDRVISPRGGAPEVPAARRSRMGRRRAHMHGGTGEDEDEESDEGALTHRMAQALADRGPSGTRLGRRRGSRTQSELQHAATSVRASGGGDAARSHRQPLRGSTGTVLSSIGRASRDTGIGGEGAGGAGIGGEGASEARVSLDSSVQRTAARLGGALGTGDDDSGGGGGGGGGGDGHRGPSSFADAASFFMGALGPEEKEEQEKEEAAGGEASRGTAEGEDAPPSAAEGAGAEGSSGGSYSDDFDEGDSGGAYPRSETAGGGSSPEGEGSAAAHTALPRAQGTAAVLEEEAGHQQPAVAEAGKGDSVTVAIPKATAEDEGEGAEGQQQQVVGGEESDRVEVLAATLHGRAGSGGEAEGEIGPQSTEQHAEEQEEEEEEGREEVGLAATRVASAARVGGETAEAGPVSGGASPQGDAVPRPAAWTEEEEPGTLGRGEALLGTGAAKEQQHEEEPEEEGNGEGVVLHGTMGSTMPPGLLAETRRVGAPALPQPLPSAAEPVSSGAAAVDASSGRRHDARFSTMTLDTSSEAEEAEKHEFWRQHAKLEAAATGSDAATGAGAGAELAATAHRDGAAETGAAAEAPPAGLAHLGLGDGPPQYTVLPWSDFASALPGGILALEPVRTSVRSSQRSEERGGTEGEGKKEAARTRRGVTRSARGRGAKRGRRRSARGRLAGRGREGAAPLRRSQPARGRSRASAGSGRRARAGSTRPRSAHPPLREAGRPSARAPRNAWGPDEEEEEYAFEEEEEEEEEEGGEGEWEGRGVGEDQEAHMPSASGGRGRGSASAQALRDVMTAARSAAEEAAATRRAVEASVREMRASRREESRAGAGAGSSAQWRSSGREGREEEEEEEEEGGDGEGESTAAARPSSPPQPAVEGGRGGERVRVARERVEEGMAEARAAATGRAESLTRRLDEVEQERETERSAWQARFREQARRIASLEADARSAHEAYDAARSAWDGEREELLARVAAAEQGGPGSAQGERGAARGGEGAPLSAVLRDSLRDRARGVEEALRQQGQTSQGHSARYARGPAASGQDAGGAGGKKEGLEEEGEAPAPLTAQEADMLRKEMEAQERIIAGYQRENERLMQETRRAAADAARAKADVGRLRGAAEAAKEAVASGGGSMESQAETLRARLRAEQEAAALRDELAELRQKQQDTNFELDRARTQLKEQQQQQQPQQQQQGTGVGAAGHARVAALLAEREAHGKEVSALRQQLDATRRKLQWYQENQTLLGEQEEEVSALRAQVEELKQRSRQGGKREQPGAAARRVRELEGQVRELREALSRRDPDCLANLIAASKDEDEEKQALQQRVAQMEEEAKRRTEESSRKLRALQQQHEQFTAKLQDRIEELEDQVKAQGSRAAPAKRKPKRRQGEAAPAPAPAPATAPAPAPVARAGQDASAPSGGEHAARQAAQEAREAAEAEAAAARGSLADLQRVVVERCLAFAMAHDLELDSADPNDASATLRATLGACERALQRQRAEVGAQEAKGVTEARADAAGRQRQLEDALSQASARAQDAAQRAEAAEARRAELEGQCGELRGRCDELQQQLHLAQSRRDEAAPQSGSPGAWRQVKALEDKMGRIEASHTSREQHLVQIAERLSERHEAELASVRNDYRKQVAEKDRQLCAFREELDSFVGMLARLQGGQQQRASHMR